MKRAVVDASIVVKWIVAEAHSELAQRLLTNDVDLYAPGHWLAEVSTTLWAKYAIRKSLTREEAAVRIEWVRDLIVAETPLRDLTLHATEIAFDLHLTVYDTLYLALASKAAAPLVTADRKLYDKAKSHHHFVDLVVWVEDLAAPG